MQDEIDKLIQDVVRKENETDLLADEAPITEMIIQNFRGKRKWLSIVPVVESLISAALMFWCGYQFFQEETTKYQIAWATGFLTCAITVGLLKIWLWGEWRRNSLAREIKRLELAIGDLRNRMEP